jgi:adenylate kinase family enzyme
MYKQTLAQLKEYFSKLKSEGIDLDKTLDLVDKILLYTDDLLKEIERVDNKTNAIEERLEQLKEDYYELFDLIRQVVELSYSEPERALQLLQNLQTLRSDNNFLN